MYVDGAEVARDTQADVGGSEGDLYIGVDENLQSGSFWSGMLDDVRLYDHLVLPNDVLEPPKPIKSDYDGNGRIDSIDLRILASEWLNCYSLHNQSLEARIVER